MGRVMKSALLSGLALLLLQGGQSGRAPHTKEGGNTDFNLDELADWSSFPSNLAASHRVITDQHQEEEEGEEEMTKRDGRFDISDLVSEFDIPGASETATAAADAASEDFKLDDLADWSSIPSNLEASHRVITDHQGEQDEAEVK